MRRAAGGFAVVFTCAAHVSPDGQGFPGQLGVWGDHQLPGLTRLAADLASRGALGMVQLYHGGVRSPSALTGLQPLSASAFDEEEALEEGVGHEAGAKAALLEAGVGARGEGLELGDTTGLE